MLLPRCWLLGVAGAAGALAELRGAARGERDRAGGVGGPAAEAGLAEAITRKHESNAKRVENAATPKTKLKKVCYG